MLENFSLALVIITRHLRPYFLLHPIIVLTNSAIGRVLANPETTGRLIKWTTKLNEYNI